MIDQWEREGFGKEVDGGHVGGEECGWGGGRVRANSAVGEGLKRR